MIGGISGLASGAIGALGPAFEGGDVAAQVGEKAAEQTAQQGTQQLAQEGAQQLAQQGTQQLAQEGVQQTTQQVAQKSAEQLAQEGAQQTANQGIAALPQPISQGNGVVTQGLGANTPVAQGEVTSGMAGQVTSEAPVNSNVLYNAPGKEAGVTTVHTAPESTAGWGQQLLNKAGIESQVGSKIGGQALENAVYGAGINGLLAGAQGQDVGKAMGRGVISGGIGGAAAGGLGEMGGSIGEFATAHPNITSGAIGMGANMALGNMIPDSSNNGMPESSPIKSKYRWNPDTYNAYLPRGNSFGSFAAGGITDLDNYDQTPQMQSPGTLDIPNRNEVANNQGYMGDSVQLMAHGGISDLGGYSDGGRLLKGPGTGVSDDIPATIEGKQPARLAANEFVVPARIVSEIGNGSTDAGAKALYAMMDRVQNDRKKSMGKGKFAVDSKAARHLDAL
jgi:hypothetical protein